MVCTSYYGNSAKLLESGFELVSISRSAPRGFKGEKLLSLAPTWAMLKMSDEDYDKNYKKILQSNDPHAIMQMFEGRNVALLCWEKDENQCHRKQVAEWFRSNGYDVREFGKEYEQMTLF